VNSFATSSNLFTKAQHWVKKCERGNRNHDIVLVAEYNFCLFDTFILAVN